MPWQGLALALLPLPLSNKPPLQHTEATHTRTHKPVSANGAEKNVDSREKVEKSIGEKPFFPPPALSGHTQTEEGH